MWNGRRIASRTATHHSITAAVDFLEVKTQQWVLPVACCRTTANIVALQLGRPIDPKRFRPAWLNVSAMAAGWDWDYLQGPEDLEAERLFDYGLLAPVDTGAPPSPALPPQQQQQHVQCFRLLPL